MKCPTCDFLNAEISKFCMNCGTGLAVDCARCGHVSRLPARFCSECGAVLAAGNAELRQQEVANDLPDAAAHHRPAREGARQLVSILFADVVDSTRLMEEHDAEEATRRVEVLLERMREAVRQYDGTVNKVQGDGLMAIFGAPQPREDHAVRACCAALSMRRALTALGPDWPATRIGVHTGEAVLRSFETDFAPQFDAMGLTVHIAARVERTASRGDVAVSESTAQAARDQIEFEPLGEYRVKGLSHPVSLFKPVRIRTLMASEQFRGGQTLTPFAGRAAEMAVLARALERASVGEGGCIVVEGEPGQGKSRLFYEFAEKCRARGLPVLEARATAQGRMTPHFTALSLLRSLMGVEPDTPAEDAVRRTIARLEQFGETAAAETALLLDFMGLKPAETMAPAAASARHARLLAMIGRLVRGAGQARSVIVLEDLHWLDGSSEPFFNALVDALPGTSALLLCNHRPGYRNSCLEQSFCRKMVLSPLDDATITALVDARLRHHPALIRHRGEIVTKAAGNPFFGEELARVLLDDPRPAGGVAKLPDSVRGVVEARLGRLDETDLSFLQAAAVIGRDFDVGLGQQVSAMPAAEVSSSVHRLLASELVYERVSLGKALAFRHPLVQEVAYNSMLRSRRAELHRRCARSLAATAGDDAQAALAAQHWEHGGDRERAVAGYAKAALWAGARAPAHALESWRAVRRLLDGATPSNQPSDQSDYMRMMAGGQIVNLAWREGLEPDEVVSVFDEAVAIARRLQDTRAIALLTLAYGRFLAVSGSADDYLAYAERARTEAAPAGDPSLDALMLAIHSHALVMAGFVDRGLAANGEALARVGDIGKREIQTLGYDVRHWLIALRARLLLLAGRPAEAQSVLDSLLGDPSENVDALHRTMALAVAAELAALDRRADRVRACFVEMEAIAREQPTPYLRVLSLRMRGSATLRLGNSSEAERLFTEALQLLRRHRAGLEVEPQIILGLSEAVAPNDPARSRALRNEALALSDRRGMRVGTGLALVAKLRAEPDAVDARRRLDEIVAETGARFLDRLG